MQNYEKGGIRAQRGFLSQTYSLLFYLLVRFYDYKDLEIVIESSEGEDAKFSYTIRQGDETIHVIELIQCKKRESGASTDIHAGAMKDDEWLAGKITLSDLVDWVKTKRPTHSVADLLANDTNLYYTALVFGELANKVSKFTPEGLRAAASFRWYSSTFATAFPPDFRHKQDPVLGNSFGTQDIRSRVRVLRVPAPFEMEAQCELLLRQLYKVSTRRSADIVQKLRIEIENRGVADREENRRLLPRDLDAIIAQGQSSQGNWQEANDFLEQNESLGADANKGESPRWIDFEKKRYLHRSEFDTAWAALEQDGRVVISGPAGTGKTTLCRFLAFRFLKQSPQHRAYYLSITPIESLQDEIDFLKDQIHSETLFIVDDQHLARKEVEQLVQLFMDFQQEGKARAKLIVTSNITYTRNLSPVGGRRGSELSQSPSVRMLPVKENEMQSILSSLKSKAGLNPSLPVQTLASASEGNIGLALILASCAQGMSRTSSLRRLLESSVLGQTLRDWILNQLGRPGDYKFFGREIAPIFIVSSYGISVPENFTRGVKPLHDAGFLELIKSDSDASTFFRPFNLRLAFIIDRQYNKQRVETAESYFKKYPKHLPILCEQLASYDYNLPTLEELFKRKNDDFVRVINDRFEPISLNGVSKILNSLYEGVRPDGIKLLRSIAAPLGQPDARFFSNFINLERAKDTLALKNFFEVTYQIDRYLMRRMADEHLGWMETEFILGLFELDDCHLDEIAACLYAINRCSRKFAMQLYDTLKQSAAFAAKIASTDSNPRGLSIWTRFCEKMRSLNRLESYAYMEEHLPPDKVLSAILSEPDLNSMARLLFRLRRINPRMAADVFSTLWQDHRETLERLLLNENQLDALRAYLNALARINRRLTIYFTSQILEHLRALVSQENRYRQIGSTVQFLHSRISMSIARATLESINKERVLLSMQQEDRAWDLVGKNLYDYAQISADTAAWFEERLDYLVYRRQVQSVSRHLHMVYIIRGLLVAARPERKKDLLQTLLHDNELIEGFERGWEATANLSEMTLYLSLLRDIPLDKSTILKLLDIPNLSVFQEQVLRKFSRERAVGHIANGLFAVAKFDFDIAVEVLYRYVEKINAEAQSEGPADRARGNRVGRRDVRRLPRGYEPTNLVDVGCLLQVAAAITPANARQLAALIDIQRFSAFAIDEANLGRLAVFMMGLHKASRKLARDFVQAICSEEVWERQFLENEEPENVIHYARALRQISRSKSNDYIKFVFKNHRDEIESFLKIEANLMLISNWFRVLLVCGMEFAHEQVESISPELSSIADLDKRLRHLLEATEALIDCGDIPLGRQFAELALRENSQMRSVRRLHDWLTLFHKSLRIGRDLQMPDFSERLFHLLDGWHLGIIIGFEGQALLPAYTYHLMKNVEVPGLERFKDSVVNLRPAILKAAREERYVVHKTLALIFADASLQEIRETIESSDWHRPWEMGLVALMFANNFPGEELPFITPKNVSPDELRELIQQELNEDTNNLEFALTLYLLAASGLSQDLEKYQLACSERVADEAFGATRWFLQQKPGEIHFNQLYHYTWFILKNTALRSTYLSWERDIESAVSSAIFKQTYTRDLNAILQ